MSSVIIHEIKKIILGDKEALEKRHGARYTVLELLPYFDCIKMVSIDAMHNHFMGTSKMMTQLWIEAGYLNQNTLSRIRVV